MSDDKVSDHKEAERSPAAAEAAAGQPVAGPGAPAVGGTASGASAAAAVESAPAAPPPDPMQNRYGQLACDAAGLKQRRDGQAAQRLVAALREDGWELPPHLLRITDGDARATAELMRCLVIAQTLASQQFAQHVDYFWEDSTGGRHVFRVDAPKPLEIGFALELVRDHLQDAQLGVWVETLMRDLRAAAKEGQALRVTPGRILRRPLAPAVGGEPAAAPHSGEAPPPASS